MTNSTNLTDIKMYLVITYCSISDLQLQNLTDYYNSTLPKLHKLLNNCNERLIRGFESLEI
jgi:hypothetical protein